MKITIVIFVSFAWY